MKRSRGVLKFCKVAVSRLEAAFRLNAADAHWIASMLAGSEPVPKTAQLQPNTNEKYWCEWLREYIKVSASISRLEQSSAYLPLYQKAWYTARKKLDEAAWLQYHIEKYLQEEFILYCRLRALLRQVEKLCISKTDRGALTEIASLRRFLEKACKRPVALRGRHVHEQHMEDQKLASLQSMIFFGQIIPLKEIDESLHRIGEGLRRKKYVELRKWWKRELTTGNRAIERLCGEIFESITKILIRHEPTRPV